MDESKDASVIIYNMRGKEVWRKDISAIAGVNQLLWDLRNNIGLSVANGVYILKIITDDKIITKKIAVIK